MVELGGVEGVLVVPQTGLVHLAAPHQVLQLHLVEVAALAVLGLDPPGHQVWTVQQTPDINLRLHRGHRLSNVVAVEADPACSSSGARQYKPLGSVYPEGGDEILEDGLENMFAVEIIVPSQAGGAPGTFRYNRNEF